MYPFHRYYFVLVLDAHLYLVLAALGITLEGEGTTEMLGSDPKHALTQPCKGEQSNERLAFFETAVSVANCSPLINIRSLFRQLVRMARI